jgi:hypothetical protein
MTYNVQQDKELLRSTLKTELDSVIVKVLKSNVYNDLKPGEVIKSVKIELSDLQTRVIVEGEVWATVDICYNDEGRVSIETRYLKDMH